MHSSSQPTQHLKTTEERLARLSVLQELTVTALDLFNAEASADLFLERVAERLGALAAAWVAMGAPPGVTLVGSAGLSEASRALPLPPLPLGSADLLSLKLGYPELARAGLVRWNFGFREGAGPRANGGHALLLWFDPARSPPEEYRSAIERLVDVLVTVVTHRRLALDLRRSYEELARTQLVLVERERLAAVGELAAVVAHEVRNPLAVIFNCIGSLEKSGAPPFDTKTLLGILAEEATRLNQIVSELLDFARPGDVHLRSESLEEIVKTAIEAVRSAHAAPLTINLDVPQSLPAQRLDARLVRRAVINLLTNAAQATAIGGRVDVRLTEDTSVLAQGIRLDVTDDGIGISADVCGRIFEPFFTTKAFGTGLGLSIVKHAAEAHQGDITVTSREGEGTTFTLRLPRLPLRARHPGGVAC